MSEKIDKPFPDTEINVSKVEKEEETAKTTKTAKTVKTANNATDFQECQRKNGQLKYNI